MTSEQLPVAKFAFPGPLRDKLVDAILCGEKTATTGLLREHEHEGEPLPAAGQRFVVVDSYEREVAVIETTAVQVIPVRDVDLELARDEGEGFTSVAEWRAAHESFWHSDAVGSALDDPDFTVTDDTLVVAERFRLLHRLL